MTARAHVCLGDRLRLADGLSLKALPNMILLPGAHAP